MFLTTAPPLLFLNETFQNRLALIEKSNSILASRLEGYQKSYK